MLHNTRMHRTFDRPIQAQVLAFLFKSSRQNHPPDPHTPIRTPTQHPPLPTPRRDLATRVSIDTHTRTGEPRYDGPAHRRSPRHMDVPRKRRFEGVYVHVCVERSRREVRRGEGKRGNTCRMVRPFIGAFLCARERGKC